MPEPIGLPELPVDQPAGPDLSLDVRFREMEAAARGKAEGQFGNTIDPAVPPDWRLTEQIATDLLGETRDLRIMAFLAIARLNLAGLPGFAACLGMIRHHLDTLWDRVHPELDPEEENDPLPRANALLSLQNPVTVLRAVRDAPLAVVPASTLRAMQEAGIGNLPRPTPVRYRDLAVLSGSSELEAGAGILSEAEARDIFAAASKAQVASVREAVAAAIGDVAGIAAGFDRHAPPGSGPDLSSLTKLLHDVSREMERFEAVVETASVYQGSADPVDGDPAGPGRDDDARGTAAPRAVATIRAIIALTHREDAMHALQLASSFFRTHEPSSPLPLLIDRAVRLAPLPFLDVLKDLAPDGLMQARMVAGTQE